MADSGPVVCVCGATWVLAQWKVLQDGEVVEYCCLSCPTPGCQGNIKEHKA